MVTQMIENYIGTQEKFAQKAKLESAFKILYWGTIPDS